ncbi:PREDICTED: uncharacterized protein LOC104597697 [Nelumbo nucifera]|uniref:Uncharacterized protein LOC104597697 n=1 Tax=Nelumbo nucifera TaxID=4432 RepID=A0A1U8A879_NELNU|nr:PREDICTED: uncharacterized protein LOC104597697 [Nelumbo nucifera]
MEGSSVLSFTSSKTHLKFGFYNYYTSFRLPLFVNFRHKHIKNSGSFTKSSVLVTPPRNSLLSPALAAVDALDKTSDSLSSSKEMLPKIDKSGRFCSPRAARELALLIAYASCLEGSDPVRLLDKRVNAKREPGYEFNKALLLEYNHMNFSGPPVSTETEEEAEELLRKNEKESATEAEVLSAPPKLVYSKLILRFTKKLLVAVVDRWDKHVLIIDKIAPPSWKNEPAGRILELCILHLAMAEITVLGTRHQIVINEAVDLAKRFCDGTAPRIINGCLRTFVKDHSGTNKEQPMEKQNHDVPVGEDKVLQGCD